MTSAVGSDVSNETEAKAKAPEVDPPVTALTDAVWFCIHSTQGETRVEAIESEVIA